MVNRKELVEEILNSFHGMRHKMRTKSFNLDKNRITHSQWFVLGIIEHCKDTSIKDISGILGMSSSAATQLVDGLVRNGYVSRRTDPNDRRSVKLEISAKGNKQISALKEKRINEMAKLFEALTDSELEIYLKLHKKMVSNAF
jgi:DNA-binding MarR family transcriptional regulator